MQQIYNITMQYSYIKQLQAQQIWDLDFVAQMTGSISSAKALMHSYTKRHFVSSIRRGLYVANDLATEHPIANKFEIASAINNGCFVAYHSALEYHGFAHQIMFNVHVGSPKRFRNFNFDGLNYVCCPQTISEGVITPTYDSMVCVTDLERTIVDCTDRLDFAGGCEELLNCISAVSRVDIEKIIRYADLYNKLVLYRKLGIICNIFADSWKVQPNQMDYFRNASGNSTLSFTDRQESNTFLKSWKMYVPAELMNYYKENLSYEIL